VTWGDNSKKGVRRKSFHDKMLRSNRTTSGAMRGRSVSAAWSYSKRRTSNIRNNTNRIKVRCVGDCCWAVAATGVSSRGAICRPRSGHETTSAVISGSREVAHPQIPPDSRGAGRDVGRGPRGPLQGIAGPPRRLVAVSAVARAPTQKVASAVTRSEGRGWPLT
jgi:hypothetical protein